MGMLDLQCTRTQRSYLVVPRMISVVVCIAPTVLRSESRHREAKKSQDAWGARVDSPCVHLRAVGVVNGLDVLDRSIDVV